MPRNMSRAQPGTLDIFSVRLSALEADWLFDLHVSTGEYALPHVRWCCLRCIARWMKTHADHDYKFLISVLVQSPVFPVHALVM
jgi:hypothetical protein